MKKIVASAFLILALAPAASAWAAAWSGPATIASVDVESDASASNGTTTYLTFTPTAPANRPTCGTTNAQAEMIGTAEHVRAMTSLATAAFLAGRTIKVYWAGCNSVYPTISMLQVF